MKHFILSVINCLAVALAVTSCNFLEHDETNGLYTREDIYKYFDNTKQMLTNVYSYIPQDFGALDNAMRDCGCDDAEFGNLTGAVQYFNNGTWSPIKTCDTAWSLYYGIRAANEFLESMETSDLSRFSSDINYDNWKRQLDFFPYEARVLRAFMFFELAKRYSDIAMPLERLTTEEANTIGKTSFDDVIEFIIKECDECAEVLPVTYETEPNKETGRITKGFAMALKSKSLLYAASKLHNPEMNAEKWKRSASAALDIINTGYYALDPNPKYNNITSSEVVLARRNDNSATFELNNFPIRLTMGNRTNLATGTFPTQNLVDAFETLAGYKVTLTEGGFVCDDPAFDIRNPYAGRDPRFESTILANGNSIKDIFIDVTAGGQDDIPVSQGGSPTGYFLRKHIIENTDFTPDHKVTGKHHWVVYRYAETLLTYAESMIEAFSDPLYTDSEFPYSASWALNMVRANAGMPNVEAGDKDSFIEALRNEWRVEFAFEDHRFWDIRRWMIGSETQREVFGVSINRTSSNTSYSRFLLERRTWSDKMYLYPIPQAEMFKNPNLAPQNIGW